MREQKADQVVFWRPCVKSNLCIERTYSVEIVICVLLLLLLPTPFTQHTVGDVS
jgi:hypothetical protein